MMRRSAVYAAVAVSLLACGAGTSLPPVVVPDAAAEPRAVLVPTAPGVSIEVLDWGGSGPALVFLAGMGHTAREFDEFAPRFTDRFRVLGISRRGSGASSDVPPDSLDDLVGDIVAVLDTMRLGPAVLVGHSFGGAELALFGEKHGDRCAGLVYLDSAYDYTDSEIARIFGTTPPPAGPPMLPSDSASVAAVRAWVQRTQGISMPESEIRATRQFDASGRMVGDAPSTARRKVASLIRAPRWDAIQCPSLGVYPVPAPPETWRNYAEMSPADREQARAYVAAFGPWTAANRARFGQLPQNEVVEFPSYNHYFFLEQPEEAARVIREWAAGLR